MIKAAFFDIDGTLMAHSLGCVPEDTRRALEELKKRGVRVFTCTGRHILELDELGLTSLGFDGHVLLNGQLCLDGARRILSETPVPREDIERILPVFEERRIPIAFVEKDRIYINSIDGRVRAAQKAISSELPETGCWAGGAGWTAGERRRRRDADADTDAGHHPGRGRRDPTDPLAALLAVP